MRRIKAAAIRLPDGSVLTRPPPARHFDLMNLIGKPAKKSALVTVPQHDQGFLDSDGVFVSRAEAFGIAAAARQIRRAPPTSHGRLFTEDLW